MLSLWGTRRNAILDFLSLPLSTDGCVLLPVPIETLIVCTIIGLETTRPVGDDGVNNHDSFHIVYC